MLIFDDTLKNTTQKVAKHLSDLNWTLSSVESCTGGWLAKCCTDLAGSSHWFSSGFITYSNQAKQDLVNVSAQTLKQHGAVSEAVAIEMAIGCLNKLNTNISVAITGIAGPSGATKTKPLGMVWFAWSVKNKATTTHCMFFQGDRKSIRAQAVNYALEGIIKNARD